MATDDGVDMPGRAGETDVVSEFVAGARPLDRGGSLALWAQLEHELRQIHRVTSVSAGSGVSALARAFGTSRQTIMRVRDAAVDMSDSTSAQGPSA